MAQVKIFADSTADLSEQLITQLGITIIPLKVHINGETYLDGQTIHAAMFYEKLKAASELPTTSQPSPLDFAEAFKKAIHEGTKEIFSIHISSVMSGTYQSAVLAKGMIEEEYPEVKIEVMDSKTVSSPLGWIVTMVGRAARDGASLAEIHALAKRVREHQRIALAIDTLVYLQKGGRIGKAASLVGSLLNIKPVISVSDEGEVTPIDKARGKNKAKNKVFELLQADIPAGPVNASIFHSDQADEVDAMIEKLKMIYEIQDLQVTNIGPIVGTHLGPGAIGCVVVPLEKVFA
ncbi:DegV family protein [Hazenella sp. IB182357]|uniref:DegV family protein n=1 Tax=Polycladospora coralii TaxID=2771432 RepID=A0A926N7E9_9BACL|nr:DegV family protein [Polycladospora coralii]MBD1371391.1 DegV family protein [Polycladospora coralii]MBS7530359.1 DegV family protein [Polycladospora coralii]